MRRTLAYDVQWVISCGNVLRSFCTLRCSSLPQQEEVYEPRRMPWPALVVWLISLAWISTVQAQCNTATGIHLPLDGKNCYFYATELNWFRAKKSCFDKGMFLAEPHDRDGLYKLLNDNRIVAHCWLGARGNYEVIAWLSSGDKVDSDFKHKSIDYCMEIDPNRELSPFYTEECVTEHAYICECKESEQGSCRISSTTVKDGTKFTENCMKEFSCINGEWIYPKQEYHHKCKTCVIQNDPHFTTFDEISYDWHGQNTYVISQKGKAGCPNTFVYGKFSNCIHSGIGYGWATCIDTVYFQPDPWVYITIAKSSTDQITVNGNTQTLTGDLTVLKGIAGDEVDAFGWIFDNQIHIMGFRDQGYLVIFDSWIVTVKAYPTPSMYGKLWGLCGNSDGHKELKLRNGTVIVPPDQVFTTWLAHKVNDNFGNDWEIKTCHKNPRMISSKRDRQAPQPNENPCNATEDEIKRFVQKCQGLDNDVPNNVIAGCVFDQCIATLYGNDTVADEWLSFTNLSIEIIKQQKKNTVFPKGYNCEGNGNWSGNCFGTQDNLIGYSRCDSLVEQAPGCNGETCCVDCSRQTGLCSEQYGPSVARNVVNVNSTSPCCQISPGRLELKVGEVREGSGCSCCKFCIRRRSCRKSRKNKGKCITDEDPVYNRAWCLSQTNGTIIDNGCKGSKCHCCLWDR